MSDNVPASVKAAELKDQANTRHKAGDYLGAIQTYTLAIETHPSAQLYTNRAASYFMLKR